MSLCLAWPTTVELPECDYVAMSKEASLWNGTLRDVTKGGVPLVTVCGIMYALGWGFIHGDARQTILSILFLFFSHFSVVEIDVRHIYINKMKTKEKEDEGERKRKKKEKRKNSKKKKRTEGSLPWYSQKHRPFPNVGVNGAWTYYR